MQKNFFQTWLKLRFVKPLLFLLALVLVIVDLRVLATPQTPLAPQPSCNFVENSRSQRISWGANLPVVMYIDQSVPPSYYDAIRAAMNEWNQSMGRQVLELGGVSQDSTGPTRDNRNVIYFMKDWELNRTFEQARTTVYWADEQISEADIRVNTRDFTYSGSPIPVVGQVDFQSLMVHEMGHVLGLAHTSVSGSVMVKTLPAAQGRLPSDILRRKVGEYDLRSISCEYAVKMAGPTIESNKSRTAAVL